jgi:hypothetical protein
MKSRNSLAGAEAVLDDSGSLMRIGKCPRMGKRLGKTLGKRLGKRLEGLKPTPWRGWLPDMDLNHDKQIQSLLCYRYTIGQSIGGRR